MANELVTGTVVIRVDGRSIRSKLGAKLMVGGFERTPQYADGQLIGFTKKPIASQITCTLVHVSTTDVSLLNEIEDSTLTYECDSGAVYTCRGVFLTKPPEISDGDGEVTTEFMGQPAVQTS